MQLLRKPFRLSVHALLWTLLFGCLLAHPFTPATSSPPGTDRDYILIINTYSESSFWSRNIITNILDRVNEVNDCEVYTEYMNMLLINDAGEAEDFKRSLRQEYGKNPPRILILLGSPLAHLRDFVRETWPNVPIIFCGEYDYMGPDEAYVDRRPIPAEERRYIRDYAYDDNLTFLQAPVYLRENVRLLQQMIPGMKELVFVGDGRYINQQIDYDLRQLLPREFPDLDYKFYSAARMSTDALLDSLDNVDTRLTGVLFSSWHHTKKAGNNVILLADSYRLTASTQVPLFSLSASNIRDRGLAGGYTYDEGEYNKQLISVLNAVLKGRQPRDIPFYIPRDPRPVFNYTTLEHKGLSPHMCPPGSVFYDKPVSTLERYKWPVILIASALLVLIALQQWRIRVMQKVEQARQREVESHAKYATLFNNMPIVYIQQKVHFDAEGYPLDLEIRDVNALFEQRFLPREQVIGKLASSTIDTPQHEFLRLVNIALNENRTITYPFYYAKLDVFYEIILCRSYLPGHVDIFCLDGTALFKAQQKLTTINHKFSMALDVADIVPWKWDLRQHTLFCDSVRPRMQPFDGNIGMTDAQITIGEEQYFATIHKEDRARIRHACEELLAGRQTKVREEFRIYTNEKGHWTMEWIEAQAAVETRDVEGRPLSLVGSSLVITQRKSMEQELRSARDRAEESNRLKSAFLANMSHEIRTPLNAIVGFSEILASTEEQQEKQEYISIIENNNTLLLQLIGDILDLSKIEAGTLDFIQSDFDLDELMSEKEQVIGLRVQPGVELKLESPKGGGNNIIRTDRNRLSQVLTNLLTNASKFTQQGSIRFGWEQRGKELYFWVTDTGCGIPATHKEEVFERFVKLNNFKQGTGLGLAICRTIVEHLGGRIGVESEEGKGSTFWFTLPFHRGELKQEEEPATAPITVEKDKLTILVAEDNESNYRLFESILKHEYRLLHAWNGREAVDLYREHTPHLVLMDINMPEMNGYEATAEIRKLSADVPILAVTAFAYASDEQKVMENGFSGYAAKPISARELKKQILDILCKRMTLI